MKLMIAVIQDYDSDRLLTALSDAGIGSTRIASAGGFLRAGNTTVLIGVEEERLPLAMRLLGETCRRRTATRVSNIDLGDMEAHDIAESRIGGGVAFVAPVERHERLMPLSTMADQRSG